jgi:hypothetical protein
VFRNSYETANELYKDFLERFLYGCVVDKLSDMVVKIRDVVAFQELNQCLEIDMAAEGTLPRTGR